MSGYGDYDIEVKVRAGKVESMMFVDRRTGMRIVCPEDPRSLRVDPPEVRFYIDRNGEKKSHRPTFAIDVDGRKVDLPMKVWIGGVGPVLVQEIRLSEVEGTTPT